MVKGFGQKQGTNFDEIFSYVVKMCSIWVIQGLAASMNLQLEQLEVNTTFLHGDLDEEIFMETKKGIIKDNWHEGFGYCKAYLGERDPTRYKLTIFFHFLVITMNLSL